MVRIPEVMAPVHPGEVLVEEVIKPLGLSQTELADALGISRIRLNELANQKRGVTPDTALRLARYLGTTPDFWMNLQQAWDLYHALHSEDAEAIEKIRPYAGAH